MTAHNKRNSKKQINEVTNQNTHHVVSGAEDDAQAVAVVLQVVPGDAASGRLHQGQPGVEVAVDIVSCEDKREKQPRRGVQYIPSIVMHRSLRSTQKRVFFSSQINKILKLARGAGGGGH